jgi:lysophospholipase L1-like esterase
MGVGPITPESAATLAEDPAFLSRYVSPLARFINRARAGETLKLCCLGDSILEGQTVTNPAADGTMILLAADLSARFGTTVTQVNRATSGYTALRMFTDAKITTAITDQADLYIVSAFDKNDIGAEISGTGGLYAPGYPQAQSLARIEQALRALRREVPKADIIVLATNPYAVGSSSNAYQDAKDLIVRGIAATYGAQFIDANAPFKALGDWSAYMNDSTHPNTLGHRLIADTILAYLPNVACAPTVPGIGATSSKGVYSPELTKETVGNLGTVVSLVTGTNLSSSGLAWANTGTWTGTGGSSAYTCSTVNDYTEITGQFTELSILMSTANADDPVCDITVDSVVVASSQHFNNGKNGNYYVPIVVGLDPTTSHTVRLTVKGGTLKMQRIAAVMSQGSAPSTAVVTSNILPATSSTTTMTTSYQTLATANLALGATPVDVQLNWTVIYRNSGAMTAARRIQIRPLFGGSDVYSGSLADIPMSQEGATSNRPPHTGSALLKAQSGTKAVAIQAKVTDATDTIQVLAWRCDAVIFPAS